MYRNRIAFSLAAIISFILVILVVSYHGYRSRVFAPVRTTLAVDTPEKAFAVWQDNKVRGRILLLFDNYPHMGRLSDHGSSPQLTESNLVEFSVFNNMVRKIYLMVPDDKWEEFRRQEAINPLRRLPDIERGLYLYSMTGVLVLATTPSSLPRISEETIVYINKQVFDYEQTLEMLSRKGISSDIVVAYQGATR